MKKSKFQIKVSCPKCEHTGYHNYRKTAKIPKPHVSCQKCGKIFGERKTLDRYFPSPDNNLDSRFENYISKEK